MPMQCAPASTCSVMNSLGAVGDHIHRPAAGFRIVEKIHRRLADAADVGILGDRPLDPADDEVFVADHPFEFADLAIRLVQRA